MHKKKYFGTDGIRGEANQSPITPDLVLKIGMAIGAKFTKGAHRHRVVIGKDTRLSGYMIESALTSGFAAVGMDVFLVGPVPTPAVSMLTKSLRADIGIMISASHNLYQDNGIKIFDQEGQKLGDEIESEIEQLIDGDLTSHLAWPQNFGRVKRLDDARGRYIEFVKTSFPKEKILNDLRIVIDCANGAAYAIAPTILRELGAEVIEIGVAPNGFNINLNCGSTHPKLLSETVVTCKANLGVALDGDADRIAVVDENGKLIDGDILIGLLAQSLVNSKKLKGGAVVTTVMSNLALERFIVSLGLKFHRSSVGDRYVLAAMQKHGCNFGGENSGHLILSDYSKVGDGLIACLSLLSMIVDKKKPAKLSQLSQIFTLTPQVNRNLEFPKSKSLSEGLLEFIKTKEAELKDGRILVRKSGTENLIRVMVEGIDEAKIKNIAEQIIMKIKEEK